MTKFAAMGAPAVITTIMGAAALSSPASATANPTIPASVIVFDQPVKNQSVDVTYSYLPSKGYVVVYGSDATGKPVRQPIGTAEVAAGDHRNVKVPLTQQPTAGQKLWVSISADTDAKAGFDAKADKSVWPDALPSHNAFVVR